MASVKKGGLAKKGLGGAGLKQLLGDDIDFLTPASANELTTLPMTQIQAGEYQPRSHMDEESLLALSQSIRNQGLMQPILVRAIGSQRYEIIAGERRFRASQMAGLSEIPVLVKNVDDQKAAVMALIENMQREDLNPLEEAKGIQRLLEEFGLTHEQAAQAIGRSRSATSNLLRLLSLAEPVQTMLLAGDIDMGHARALLPLEKAQQILLATQIHSKRLSVREAERLVQQSQAPTAKKTSKKIKLNKDLQRLQTQLADYLATDIQFKMGKQQSGHLMIAFNDWSHLNALLEKQGLLDKLL